MAGGCPGQEHSQAAAPVSGIDEHIAQPGERGAVGDQPGEASLDIVSGIKPQRSAWLDHDGGLPVIERTLIRLQVDHLPGDREPKPVWLWSSATGAAADELDRCWQAFLRRSGPRAHLPPVQTGPRMDHPKDPQPQAAGRWTWLIIACHAQLRLARPLADDLRLPWDGPPRRAR